jgi:hypothetical protein
MKYASLATARLELVTKTTLKHVFLDEMEHIVPWVELVYLIEPHTPQASGAKGGR